MIRGTDAAATAAPTKTGAAVAASPPGTPVLDTATGRQAWLEASLEVSRQLLQLTDGVGPVAQNVLDHVRRLSRARTVTFVGPSKLDDSHFEVRLATGAGAGDLVGNKYRKAGTLEGRAMQEGRGFLGTAETSYCHHIHTDATPAGPLLAVPFEGADNKRGAIVASRAQGQPPFSDTELAMAEDFARQCSIALQLTEAQAVHEQLRFREHHDAETRQLHDNLIQQLFGIGVTLQTLRNLCRPADPTLEHRTTDLWLQATSQIDGVISELRATLTTAPAPNA